MVLKSLPQDYLFYFLKSFNLLEFCNILLCDENMSNFRRIFPFFYKIPCVVLYYASLTLYLINIFHGDMTFDELAHVFSVYVICIQTLYRAAVMFSKKKDIKTIILQLGCIWRTTDLSEEQVMKKNALLKRLNFRFAVLYWTGIIGAWQYMLTPLLETLFRRYVLQQEFELLLPFDCAYPFNPKKNWLTYLAIYILQMYSMFHVVYCYVGSEMILIVLSSHLSTEFVLQQHDLENIVPETNESLSDYGSYGERNKGLNMRDLIRRHQELIRLAEALDDVFNGIIFMNLTCATIMICFFGLSVIFAKGTFDKLKNFIAILSGTYPIYNVCFHAEILKEASSVVGDSTFKNLWYKGNKKHQKTIWFIIKRSQKPCYLTSIKYNKIALSTFMSVMSTSWSYFSLALTVQDNK